MVSRVDKSALSWVLVLVVSLGAGPILAQQPYRLTSEQVIAAQQKALAWLRQRQGADGSWEQHNRRGGIQRGGISGLCLLGMLNAGVPAGDPGIIKGIRYLNGIPHQSTYTVSLQCQVYAASDPKRYASQLRSAAQWLISSQKPNGMWSYTKGQDGGGDNSNTQFALLGLHEAHKAGAHVPGRVWKRTRKHFTNTQNRDGGWGYRGRSGRSYGSMTAAGLASLYICGQRLMVSGKRVFRNGAYPDCGRYRQNRALGKGIEWISQNFNVHANPGRGTWLYYWLYGLERVGMISGLRTFGPNDWYRSGAAELLGTQKLTGNWGNSAHTYDTAFALLFLAKGNLPVIIQKLQWQGHWNRNIHDLENLTGYIGQKLGRRTVWQTTSLDLPMEELRTSPILFITGHEFPEFTAEQADKLRRFVSDAGGTLLFEACCGKKEFIDGFRRFAPRVWADRPLRPLRKDHSIYSCIFPVEEKYALEGIDVGCRTGVFFSPKALSCLWELRTIPKYSQLAFQLGTNLTAYATGGNRLRNRLDVVELPETEKNTAKRRKAEVPRGAVRIARLIHEGKYDLNPNAMTNLAAMLQDQAGIDVVARSRDVHATDKGIYEYPIVFMNGLYKFELPDEQVRALREYLERGGFLMVNNGCGREEFRKSFRRMVEKLFPDKELTPLPEDHPIYTSKTGLALGEVLYRPYLARLLGRRGTNRPPLEDITIDGRTVILYSKYDYGCALEGIRPYASRGYLKESGRKLAMSIFLYAMGY